MVSGMDSREIYRIKSNEKKSRYQELLQRASALKRSTAIDIEHGLGAAHREGCQNERDFILSGA